MHDIGDDPGSVLHRARHGRGEAALGPGVAARTGLDLGGDLTFDGLEDDIDLDALLVCGAMRSPVRSCPHCRHPVTAGCASW